MSHNPCKLIENARNDPDWDFESNAELCGGDCKSCPHYIKTNSDQLDKIIENLEELNKKTENTFDETILLLKKAKKKMDEKPIEENGEKCAKEHVNNTYVEEDES